jgi:hypothetical protein
MFPADIVLYSTGLENELLMETLKIVAKRVHWVHFSNENHLRFCGTYIL